MPSDRRETISRLRDRARRRELSAHELKRLARDPRAGVRALVARHLRELHADKIERARLEAMLEHESVLWNHGALRVGGVDEVGSGPLAGPVVAAAVILPPGTLITGLNDSKQLTRTQRENVATEVRKRALAVGLGSCSPQEIDGLNILRASREAMRRAIKALALPADHLLIDAYRVPGITTPQTAIHKGDTRSLSVAAASVVAKVERDAIMELLAQRYPGYGLERHKGYPTRAHLDALRILGPSPIHRRSFSPVRESGR